jgi:hypothetical protein
VCIFAGSQRFPGLCQAGNFNTTLDTKNRTSIIRKNCPTKHCTPACTNPLLAAGVFVHSVCKLLSLLSFTGFGALVSAVAYFLFSEEWEVFLIQFCQGGKGGSSFASFALCIGFCGLQMCFHLCVG